MSEQVEEQQVQEEVQKKPEVVDAQNHEVKQQQDTGVEEQSKEKPQEEEAKPNLDDLSDDEIDSSEAPQSLKTALKRANRRLRKERQNRAQLEGRLNDIESKFNSIGSKQEADNLLKEIESDLGLDGDNSKKFYSAVDKIVERRMKDLDNKSVNSGNLTPKQSQFVEKVQQARTKYADWDELSPYMHRVMENEMKSLNQLGLNPEDVYDEDISYFYTKAVKLKAMEDVERSQKEIMTKKSEHSLASTESSKNGVARDAGPQPISQTLFNKNKSNPEWVRKNRQRILDAANKGIIRA